MALDSLLDGRAQYCDGCGKTTSVFHEATQAIRPSQPPAISGTRSTSQSAATLCGWRYGSFHA